LLHTFACCNERFRAATFEKAADHFIGHTRDAGNLSRVGRLQFILEMSLKKRKPFKIEAKKNQNTLAHATTSSLMRDNMLHRKSGYFFFFCTRAQTENKKNNLCATAVEAAWWLSRANGNCNII